MEKMWGQLQMLQSEVGQLQGKMAAAGRFHIIIVASQILRTALTGDPFQLTPSSLAAHLLRRGDTTVLALAHLGKHGSQ